MQVSHREGSCRHWVRLSQLTRALESTQVQDFKIKTQLPTYNKDLQILMNKCLSSVTASQLSSATQHIYNYASYTEFRKQVCVNI